MKPAMRSPPTFRDCATARREQNDTHAQTRYVERECSPLYRNETGWNRERGRSTKKKEKTHAVRALDDGEKRRDITFRARSSIGLRDHAATTRPVQDSENVTESSRVASVCSNGTLIVLRHKRSKMRQRERERSRCTT